MGKAKQKVRNGINIDLACRCKNILTSLFWILESKFDFYEPTEQ